MTGTVLWGTGSAIVERPASDWLAALEARAPRTRETLRLAGASRAIREFAVRELPRTGGPLGPGRLAAALSLTEEQVARVLADLEPRLFFLVRNARGEITWAFPVTVAPTPHRIRLATGPDDWENIFGA